MKHSRALQSDSITSDAFNNGKKDHPCPIKADIKTIFILIIQRQKYVAKGPSHSEIPWEREMLEANSV